MTRPAIDNPAVAQLPNLLREDLPLPAAVIYQSRLENNLRWMQEFADARGVLLAPHGKTTMTPALFQRQMEAGAWGLTLATVAQVEAAFQAGIRRVLMANQLVGKQNMATIGELLASSPENPLDFYCLVDSADNVHQLGKYFGARNQSLQLLLEIGIPGGRCGCRTREQIAEVCATIGKYPTLKLAGVETYEGLIHGDHVDAREREAEIRVREHLIAVRETCLQLLRDELFDTERVLLSGAGSAWYDLVAEEFTRHDESRVKVVLRPGCYLIHDRGIYLDAQSKVRARMGEHCCPGGDLESSLEVWAYVQSLPEPDMAILGLGKRNAAFDAGLPQPSLHYRPGAPSVNPAPRGWTVVGMMDQHCTLRLPPNHELRIGDMVAVTTSHPCLTFDKWRELLLIDDAYNLLQRLETCF